MRFIYSDPTPTWRLPTPKARQVLSTATSPSGASSPRRHRQKSEKTAMLPLWTKPEVDCDIGDYFPLKPRDIVAKIAPLIFAVSATLLDDEPNSLTTSCLCCANVGRRRSATAAFEQLETSASIHPSASR